jgi:hypothetical protein
VKGGNGLLYWGYGFAFSPKFITMKKRGGRVQYLIYCVYYCLKDVGAAETYIKI